MQTTLVAVVRGSGADLYARPGGDLIQRLETGTAVTTLARTPDDHWLLTTTSSGAAGWLEADRVVVFNLASLPVIAADVVEGPTALGEQAPPLPQISAVPAVTAVSVEEQTPTATFTPSPTVTAQATLRPTPAPVLGQVTASVNAGGSRLNIRRGPSTDFVVIDKALPGEVFVASGRSEDGAWVLIEAGEVPGGSGWVATEYVELSEPVTELPVLDQSGTASAATTAAAGNGESASVPSAELSGKLAVQSAPGEAIFVHDFATGSSTRVTSGFDPALSPDGYNDCLYA